MSMFLCPVCGEPLTQTEKSYTCPSGHSFDRAAAGYVNLLLANQKHSTAPGDDKGMAKARRAFLSGGWYRPLRDKLCELTCTIASDSSCILDAGCGEGYYTAGIYEALCQAGKTPRMAGTDISTFVIKPAAKKVKAVEFAVASSYRLPLETASVDVLINCFSPMAREEFCRILKPGGTLLYVVPAAKHLWELKEVLYETPYENEEQTILYDGLTEIAVVPVNTNMDLPNQSVIHNLFQMTPYYWKTPKSGTDRLSQLDTLSVTASFRIHVFKRD